MTCAGCGGGEVDGRQIHMHDCPQLERDRVYRHERTAELRRERRRERFDPRWRWDISTETMICAPILVATIVLVLLVFAGVIS